MNIGYARVSTSDQNLELQLDALHKAGCETIFQEKASGATKARPELDRLLAGLRTGDTVYIYKPDRLGRFLKHLLDMVAELEFRGVGLVSLTDAINTTSAQGRVGGRRRGLSEEAERTAIVAETRYREQKLGVNEIAQRLRISKVTLYKYLRHRGVVIHSHRKAATAKITE